MGLSSCTTLIDTGGYLDAVGKQVPSHQLVEKKVSWGITQEPAPFSVFKRDSTYYVELPVVFIPAEDRDFVPLVANFGMFIGRNKKFIYPDDKRDLREIKKHRTGKETYYAVLTEKQFETKLVFNNTKEWERGALLATGDVLERYIILKERFEKNIKVL